MITSSTALFWRSKGFTTIRSRNGFITRWSPSSFRFYVHDCFLLLLILPAPHTGLLHHIFWVSLAHPKLS
jgi:hypothetical protein